MTRTFMVIGAIFAFLAVGIGAFGAHALEPHFETYPERQPTYETAVQYQMFHVVGIFMAAWLDDRRPSRIAKLAGWFFGAGILLFSGSLYILAIFQISIMGAIAPLGGTSFLIGWGLTAISAWHSK